MNNYLLPLLLILFSFQAAAQLNLSAPLSQDIQICYDSEILQVEMDPEYTLSNKLKLSVFFPAGIAAGAFESRR